MNAEKMPLRILCIGDSITHGRQGNESDPSCPPTYSYRYPLFQMLVDGDVNFEFVGLHEGGFEGSPVYVPYRNRAFDNRHEAYWGWTTWGVAEKIEAHAAEEQPDMALVMLGGNDDIGKIGTELSVDAEGRILTALRRANPNVALFLGLPFQEWAPFPEFAQALRDFAERNSEPCSPIVWVDQGRGWVSDPTMPDTCTVDWVHPNRRGDRMLAFNFVVAMHPFIRRRQPLRFSES